MASSSFATVENDKDRKLISAQTVGKQCFATVENDKDRKPKPTQNN